MRWFRELYDKYEWAINIGQLVLALGAGGVVVKIVASFVELDLGWELSIFALTTGILLVGLQYLPRPAHHAPLVDAPAPAPETPEPQPTADPTDAQIARQEQRNKLDALHEVLATLTRQQGILQNWISSRDKFFPNDRGDWDTNKHALTGDPEFSQVVQFINRAFNAVALVETHGAYWDQGIHQRALKELEKAIAIVEAALDHSDWKVES